MDLQELTNDSDWSEAFSYGVSDIRPAPPDSNVSLSVFKPEDVSRIFNTAEGENDEKEWLIFGRLVDGRYFFIAAGCDFTGWDCQAGGHSFVSDNPIDLIRFGMDADERDRLELTAMSTDITTDITFKCPECGLEFIHAFDCSQRVEPPAEMPIAAPTVETPEPEPQTTFLLTCNDGSQYEMPSNHPDIAIGGFLDSDGQYRGTEVIMHNPDFLPPHFKKYYLAGSRNVMPELPPTSEVVEGKRSGKKAKKTLKKIRRIVDAEEIGTIETLGRVRRLLNEHFS